jgi:hypothetical protein
MGYGVGSWSTAAMFLFQPESSNRIAERMTEPKQRQVCGEVHGPRNPIPRTREAYRAHGLLWVDPRSTEWGDGMPLSKEKLDRRAVGAAADDVANSG